MVHSICDSYPKFGAAAPRQTGLITRRKKWGRLTPPPPPTSKCRVKSMGKISTTSFSHQNISIYWEWCWLRSSVMTQATVCIGDPPKVIWGHLRSPTVFLRITFDPKEIETWEWSHCVSLIKTHRYICNIDLLGSPRDHDLRSNFDLDLSRSCCTCFDASWRGKHDGFKIIALSFQTRKLSPKNCFAQKCRFWPFVTSDA